MFQNFFSIINYPTRITDTSATVLDHIWTDISKHAVKSGIITSPISDHPPDLHLQLSNQNKNNRVTILQKQGNLLHKFMLDSAQRCKTLTLNHFK